MFRKAIDMIKTVIRNIRSFFREGVRIALTPYKELSWQKAIIKTLIYLVSFVFIISIAAIVLFTIVTAYVFGSVASSFGPGIENGINEATGRNRYRGF